MKVFCWKSLFFGALASVVMSLTVFNIPNVQAITNIPCDVMYTSNAFPSPNSEIFSITFSDTGVTQQQVTDFNYSGNRYANALALNHNGSYLTSIDSYDINLARYLSDLNASPGGIPFNTISLDRILGGGGAPDGSEYIMASTNGSVLTSGPISMTRLVDNGSGAPSIDTSYGVKVVANAPGNPQNYMGTSSGFFMDIGFKDADTIISGYQVSAQDAIHFYEIRDISTSPVAHHIGSLSYRTITGETAVGIGGVMTNYPGDSDNEYVMLTAPFSGATVKYYKITFVGGVPQYEFLGEVPGGIIGDLASCRGHNEAPIGEKRVSADDNQQQLRWNIQWTNPDNKYGLDTLVIDTIPEETTYVTNSLECVAAGSSATRRCEFDPIERQIIWEGSIGSDKRNSVPENTVSISFTTDIAANVTTVRNQAIAHYDRDDDGRSIPDQNQALATTVSDYSTTEAIGDATVWTRQQPTSEDSSASTGVVKESQLADTGVSAVFVVISAIGLCGAGVVVVNRWS